MVLRCALNGDSISDYPDYTIITLT